jgi:hypothetical protein
MAEVESAEITVTNTQSGMMRRSSEEPERYGDSSTWTAGPVDREPALAAPRSLARVVLSGCGKIGMVALLFAVAIGMSQGHSRSAGPDPDSEAPEAPGSGTIVASEVIHLRIPETLAKIATQQGRSPGIRVHADLRRALERLDQRGLWYSVTIGARQANGAQSEMTFIRHPYDEPQHFPEVMRVLARARAARGEAVWFPDASVDMISDELDRQGPSWLIARLSRPGRVESSDDP